jgi:ankyrin repeat protein
VVEVLVKSGFEVNARTSQGTALHEAALCGKVDVVKTLLDAGVDVCVADSQRRTAVDRLNEVGLKTPVAKEIAELIRSKWW